MKSVMDASYLEFCRTDCERKSLEAFIRDGHGGKAAASLGVHTRSLERALQRIRLHAAQRGYAPAYDMTHPTPPTHGLKGTSTFYDGEGRMRGQWVKTDKVELERQAAFQAFVDGLKEDIPRAAKIAKPKTPAKKDLHTLYPITDYHLGMLAWGEECGEDWDLNIAETTLYKWFEHAVAIAPDSYSCTFAQMGDFLHWDGLEALTPASKHVLDADTRFQKVVRSAIRVIRRIIALLLTKHHHVHIIMADANHDPASSVWLREMLTEFYDKEPRVVIDNSPDTYYAYRFGKTLLMFHHGHKKGPSNIDTVLVAKFRELYGQTEYHYAFTGHLHHKRVVESNLMHIEQLPTLSPKDAYSSRAGFMSKRAADVMVFHREYGAVGRSILRPEMLK